MTKPQLRAALSSNRRAAEREALAFDARRHSGHQCALSHHIWRATTQFLQFSPHSLAYSQENDERKKNKKVASTGGSAIPVTQWEPTCASAAASSRDAKIRLINDDPYRTISDIKLKRTDTTLDLSQKAEDIC
jgi:hypothetical protein